MISLPWGVNLPLGVKNTCSVRYDVTSERHTAETAMEIAYHRLEREIAAQIPEAQILEKRIETEMGENTYVLVCTIRCIEDIAETVEFDADLR